MAAARSYRDDLQCPHCGSNRLPKDGHSQASKPTAAASAITASLPTATATTTRHRSQNRPSICTAKAWAIAAISRVLEAKLGKTYTWVKRVGAPWGFGFGDDAAPAVGHCAGDFLWRDVDLPAGAVWEEAAGSVDLDGGA